MTLSDDQFEQQFRDGTLDPAVFNHEAHLRLAWIHISRYGADQAIDNIREQLLHYVDLLGARDKYNVTLTIAAIKAVDHFMRKTQAADFAGFIGQNPRLQYHFKELIAAHYGVDIFQSESAKVVFLEPDLLPFT